MRFDLRKIALLLVLAAPAAQAQLWSGLAAVEIRVEDPKGLPVAGAALMLQYNGVNPKDGPPAVLTDSRGKATVGGLAEGSWHLEVSHEGFMTYLAEITVREKGRLVLEEAAQFNVVGATRMMRVQISRAKSGPVPRPSAVAEKIPPQAPAPSSPPPAEPPAPQPETPPPPATPREETTPAPAPVPSPPAPTAPPQPAPEPTPEQPAAPPAPEPPMARPTTPPAPTPPAPAPVSQPEAPPAPEPPQAKPVTPPAPAPPAAPAPVPEPALRPAPAPPAAPPADPVRLRTSKDRTCFECPPGESALSTERVIPSGGGSGCGADIAARLQNGEIPPGLPAGCHVLRIAVPAGMRYTGYRFEVQTGGDSLDCLAGQNCPQSTGRWPINPVLLRQPEGTIILAPFEAGPAERERRAVLTVYFTEGKRPR